APASAPGAKRPSQKPRLHPAGQLGRGSFGRASQIWNASLNSLMCSTSPPRTLNDGYPPKAHPAVPRDESVRLTDFREQAAAAIVWRFETRLVFRQSCCCCPRRHTSGAHQLDLETTTVAMGRTLFFPSCRTCGAVVPSGR